MKGFIITSVSNVGAVALDQCIQEENVELQKRSLIERLKFNKVWIRKTSRDPLTDFWEVNPDAVRFVSLDPDFLTKCVLDVHSAMILNGAHVNIDYIIEVFPL